jgi:hypothetical protein
MNKDELFKIVESQLVLLNDTLPHTQKFVVNHDTILFGRGSNIDSMSLVSVIVDLEGYFFDEKGLDLSLTDDRAMTREVSPFDSVSTLVDYLYEITNE